MKNVYSNIYTFNKKILKKTIKYLNEGSIIGLPTETVYGIAANAYSQKAVVKIFKLKGRPKKNPLIIHYHNINDLKDDVILNKNFIKLYKKFCPGPITFILKKNKNSKVCTRATANLNTVAIRFPSHKVVRAILNYINFPIAMPSANLSSALSPISAYDVFEDFKDKLKLIVNGGKSKIGIESTVIDLSGKPKILRPGIIGANEIRNAIKEKDRNIEVEVLTSDFNGSKEAVKTVIDSPIKVFAQNIETVERLTHPIRDPRAGYSKTLKVLRFAKQMNPKIITKTSIIVGLGETDEEIYKTYKDLRDHKVDIVTLGQYLRPTLNHHPVDRWVTPQQFEKYRQKGLDYGFLEVISGPMVRSSYRAERALDFNNAGL